MTEGRKSKPDWLTNIEFNANFLQGVIAAVVVIVTTLYASTGYYAEWLTAPYGGKAFEYRTQETHDSLGLTVLGFEVRNPGPAAAKDVHMSVKVGDNTFDRESKTFKSGLQVMQVGSASLDYDTDGGGIVIKVVPGLDGKPAPLGAHQHFGVAFKHDSPSWAPLSVHMIESGGKTKPIVQEISTSIPDRSWLNKNGFWAVPAFVLVCFFLMAYYWKVSRQSVEEHMENERHKIEAAGFNKAIETAKPIFVDGAVDSDKFEDEMKKIAKTLSPKESSDDKK